ncbi:hypothetical protein OSB04_015630 [Centaurea solstitialis]|uniref:Transmembrane protein n=1 Tax=Centaurea solstitialis TaxID=347529 RepID=A0AA38WGQ5_9ASTR|nr:hypothetical protein OSB04_015630 [Centaurea solstitialis]
MMMMADQIKKHNIKSTPKTHFIKLNNIFSIFIFIFLISFSVSICSYTHHFPNFTDSNDRHYIFLLCNGILFFLIMNFNSTHDSSLNQNQPVEIDHPPVVVSSAMEPVAAVEEEIEEEMGEQIVEDDEEFKQNVNRVFVNEGRNDVSIIQDQIEDRKDISIIKDQIEDCNDLSVIEDRMVEEQETGESEEAAETEELNKRCAEFIRNMKERMKFESSYRYRSLQSTKTNATISFLE